MEIPIYAKVAAGVCLLWLLRYLYQELTIGAARRRIIRENGCKPVKKVPTIDPIWGLDLLIRVIWMIGDHNLLDKNLEMFQKYGNTLYIRLLNLTAISTCEPENVKTMLALKFNDFELGEKRRHSLGPLLGQGIFTNDGAAWEHSRAMIRPNFARSQVGDLSTFERHIRRLIELIPRNGETVDLQTLFFQLTMDSATEFLFGKSCNSLDASQTNLSTAGFAEAFNAAQDGLNRQEMYGIFAKLIPDRKFQTDIKIVHDFVDSYVQDALSRRHAQTPEKSNTDKDRYIFLNELVKETEDPILLRDESLNVLLAGRDTTASLLSNCWFVLAKRPDIWAKLRAEVDTLHGEPPTYQQLKEMKYLRYTLNESLRLHPVVPGNSRTAIRDTIVPLGGGPDGKSPVFIKKGTELAWSVYTMHRRKDFFGDDAEEFRPERWEKLRPGWEYLPFNGGPRICIGQQYALTEASYTTVRMMQAFQSMESRDPDPWTEKMVLTCCSLNGTKVSLTAS